MVDMIWTLLPHYYPTFKKRVRYINHQNAFWVIQTKNPIVGDDAKQTLWNLVDFIKSYRTLQSIYVYYCSVELLLYSISFQLVSGFERLKLSRLYPYPNTF